MKYTVYNRHLNREMVYKYPASPPDKQVAWIFDTNKCIACQTCTIACKNAWTAGKGQEYMLWNNVESKPWGFYPLGWDVRLLEQLGVQEWNGNTYTGKTIFEAVGFGEEISGFLPVEEDFFYPNIGEDEVNRIVQQGEYIKMPHTPWMFYLPRICNHCTYPACLAACPRKAIYKRKEDGIVLIDQNRCRGYQECVRACPYKKSMFRAYTGKSEKCIACYPAVEEGKQTHCVQNCIGKIRMFGFLSNADNPKKDNPIDYLVHVLKIALPLYPQFGTGPNVYYIPPIHVPEEFTKQLFGPASKQAVELYKNATKDINLVGLLMLFGATDSIMTSYKVSGDLDTGSCSGYGADEQEVASVPLKEPIVIRQKYDEQRDVNRISIT